MENTISIKSKKRIDILSIIFLPTLIILMSVLRNGNLNLLYFVSPIVFLFSMKNDRRFIVNLIKWFIPFLFIFVLTITFSPYFNSMNKSLIYLLKMFLCINLFLTMLYTKKINYSKSVFSSVIFIVFLTLIAVLSQSPFLWRFNDTINSYSETRLQLFFMEPSELSEVCGILFLLELYFFIKSKNKIHLIGFILIIIPLVLSAGLSGIVYSFFTLFLFMILYEFKFLKKKKISYLFIVFLFVFILGIILLPFLSQNAIFERISAVLNGNDGSFNYRFTRAFTALKDILVTSKFIGVGLGNLRTESVSLYLGNFDLLSFSNSYLFFIAEGGLLAFIYLITLISFCFKFILKSHSIYLSKCVRFSLLFFVVIIQITGGYFTDPFLWGMYGVICSLDCGVAI